MNYTKDKRVFGLDVMRSIAILCVLFLHSFVLLISTPTLANSIVIDRDLLNRLALIRDILAYYGVEIFFVLSGFLIGSILLSLELDFKKAGALLAFWQKRWMRTLPNYFLFLTISALIFMAGSASLPNLIPYFLFLQNWLWIQPRFFLESWSLSVEEWFYFLFPITIFIFHQRLDYKKAFLLSTLIFLIVPTALRVMWVYTDHTNWDEEFRKVALLRLDAIMYGVLAAHFKRSYFKFWESSRKALLIVGLGILLVTGAFLVAVGFDNWFAKTLLFSSISLGSTFLLPFCDQWQVSKENAITRSFRSIALWSYSLYLCNVTVAFVVNLIYVSLGQSALLFGILAWFTFYLLCFLFSALLYRYFEKPVMDLRKYLVSS